ncbi:hypothetical protein PIB30_096070 [Stylosanthes scabra]|uniref:Uncharacterized protein n=1 Tax=Stylosanthes scabra TaxID=79078 RepID=A0ABU6VZL5_9FABA|nr:hypothetical protein [Stylosanthes scabra]
MDDDAVEGGATTFRSCAAPPSRSCRIFSGQALFHKEVCFSIIEVLLGNDGFEATASPPHPEPPRLLPPPSLFVILWLAPLNSISGWFL